MKTKDVIANAMKVHPGIVKVGDYGVPTGRMPTGVFPLDLALGGGLPTGKVITIYGPEQSAKTTVCLKTIALQQRLHPEKSAVFIDVENSFDPVWAQKLGVNTDTLVYVRPIAAEQAVDLCCAFMAAEDVSVIVLDSIGALVTQAEADKSAADAEVGKRGLLVGKLYRKSNYEMNLHEVESRTAPTLILINQIRYKIGVMYGDPETLPGGMPFKFGSSLILRLYGKGEADKTVSKQLDAWRTVSGVVKKAKMPIMAKSFEFKLAMVPHKSLGFGDCPDWNTVSAFAKTYELLTKDGAEWTVLGFASKTLAPIEEEYYRNPVFANDLKAKVMELALDDPAYSDGVA